MTATVYYQIAGTAHPGGERHEASWGIPRMVPLLAFTRPGCLIGHARLFRGAGGAIEVRADVTTASMPELQERMPWLSLRIEYDSEHTDAVVSGVMLTPFEPEGVRPYLLEPVAVRMKVAA